VLELLGPDLGRTAPESAVGGQQVTRDLGHGHASILGSAEGAAPTACNTARQ
jgi:hypothetical protein